MSLCALPAFAGWQYDGVYLGDGWYQDDGSRFVLSVRGGASYAMGTIENNAGAIVTEYYLSPDKTEIATKGYYEDTLGSPAGWFYAGKVDVADIPPSDDFDSFSLPAVPVWGGRSRILPSGELKLVGIIL